MASSRKPSSASTCITEKRISQWEELMRKFSEAHKEQFKVASMDIPRAERSTKFFPTGSKYEGSWDVLGMSGYGVYTFPSGVIYEGNFEDGMFHGKGLFRYANGIVVRGNFVKGVLTERTLQTDAMEYSETDWNYCTMPDRRFDIEYETGLKPAGNANLTADQPTREIPPGHYDTGDGFYDPETKVIYKYDNMSAIMRSPTTLEQKWIVKNCRVNPEKPLGPCPNLYEVFTEPVPYPEPPPPPAAGVKGEMTSFRAQSMYEDFEIYAVPHYFSSEKIPTVNESDVSVKIPVEPKPSDWFKITKQSMDSELSLTNVQLDAAVHVRDQFEMNKQSMESIFTDNQSDTAAHFGDQFKMNKQSVGSILTVDQSDAAVNIRDQLEAKKRWTDPSLKAELVSQLAAKVTFSKHKSRQHY